MKTNKNISIQDEAEMLNLILGKCIQNYGHYWAQGEMARSPQGEVGIFFRGKNNEIFRTWNEALISELGESGPEIVQSFGGWRRLCDFYFNNQGIYYARFSRIIQGVLLHAQRRSA